MSPRPVIAFAIVVAVLALAPVAEAAQRYASPTGSGMTCTQAAPCSLKEAIKKAQANDEVIVTAGSYTVTEALYPEMPGVNIYIHGELSGPMPKLSGAVPGSLILAMSPSMRLAYLDLANSQNSASAITCAFSATLERVVAKATGEFGLGIKQESNCTVRDSLAISTGPNGIALTAVGSITTATAIARNVTAIATGVNSKGVTVSCGGCFPFSPQTLDMRNVIADGVAADLEAPSEQAKAVVGNSNLTLPPSPPAAVTNLGGNQSAPPLFVNAAAGDYREAAGSPTIDAGSTDQIGTLDLAGNARVLGSAPDIGAYEYVPPPPPPAPPATLQSLTLKPKAFRTVNAGGALISKKGAKKGGPIGTTVTYSLAASGTVTFTVERKATGRKVGKKCKPQTAKNKAGKKCALYKPVKGSFTHNGAAGPNSFKFSGRLNNKALTKGSYRLGGASGGAVKSAPFTILP